MGIGMGHMALNCPHLLAQNLWMGLLLWNGNMSRGKRLHIILGNLLVLSGQESRGYPNLFTGVKWGEDDVQCIDATKHPYS